MWLNIINYVVRIIIILVGVLLVSGVISSPNWSSVFLRVMGGVFILFGIYRIFVYRAQVKKYRLLNNDDEEDDEED